MDLLRSKFNSTNKMKWYHKNLNNKYLLFPKKYRYRFNLNRKVNRNNKTKNAQETNNLMRPNKK